MVTKAYQDAPLCQTVTEKIKTMIEDKNVWKSQTHLPLLQSYDRNENFFPKKWLKALHSQTSAWQSQIHYLTMLRSTLLP